MPAFWIAVLPLLYSMFAWEKIAYCNAGVVPPASVNRYNLPLMLQKKQDWVSVAKSNPDYLYDVTVDYFGERDERKNIQIELLRDKLQQANVKYLKATRALCVRGVLEECEKTLTLLQVSAQTTRFWVWMDIFKGHPGLFSLIQKYEPDISLNTAANTIAVVSPRVSTEIHNFALDEVALGTRQFSSSELACLKGIMEYIMVPYTEKVEPQP